jgi:tubulin polyglutamylase TTLL4
MQTINKSVEKNFLTEEPNKIVFNDLFSGILCFKCKFNTNLMYTCIVMITLKILKITGPQKQNNNPEYHSALRPSLFSYMPPYIRFYSHDIKGTSIFI